MTCFLDHDLVHKLNMTHFLDHDLVHLESRQQTSRGDLHLQSGRVLIHQKRREYHFGLGFQGRCGGVVGDALN